MISLLSKKEIKINEFLTFKIPTLKEYRYNEEVRTNTEFMIGLFLTTPADRMVQYYDMGIDYNTIKEYDLFIQIFYSMFIASHNNESDEDLLSINSTYSFNVDFNNCLVWIDEDKKTPIVMDKNGNVLINEYYYRYISSIMMETYCREKNRKKAKNDEATKYFVELERKRQARLQKRKQKVTPSDILDEQIIALVNNRDFKYNFETVNELTIYDFMVSYKQIIKNWKVDNVMNGAYSGFGTVDLKKFTEKELNRFSFRDK